MIAEAVKCGGIRFWSVISMIRRLSHGAEGAGSTKIITAGQSINRTRRADLRRDKRPRSCGLLAPN
ncbi:hypothetical protein ACWZHB_27225 [Nocardia sp. FBN12]|uniref:hypothetical protein n=1 Tax=Nocardia sp. FBN12 TaxID=3419766 RepID=UPI003D017608